MAILPVPIREICFRTFLVDPAVAAMVYAIWGFSWVDAMRLLIVVLILAAFAAIPFVMNEESTVAAQTSDGQTPANEGVCDELIGATPGLYGLCVAFCEAQDCTDPDPVSAQCEPSNLKILENYNKRQQDGDPALPCVQPPPSCPCFSQEELEGLLFRDDADLSFCRKNQQVGSSFIHAAWFIQNSTPGLPDFRQSSVTFGFNSNLLPFCAFNDTYGEGESCLQKSVFQLLPLSGEIIDSCRGQIAAAGAERGFDCFL